MIDPHAGFFLLADAETPLSGIINIHAWPLVAVSAMMIVAATADACLLKVPNKITFPIILSGLLLGLYYDVMGIPDAIPPDQLGGSFRFFASFFNMMLGFFLLLPVFLIGGVGGGDVKMQMGFGAWVGAFCGLYQGMWIVIYGYMLGIVVGGLMGVLTILIYGGLAEHRENASEILQDLATLGSFNKINEKAKARKSKLTLIPYGVPLCIGYLAYLMFRYHY